MTSQTGFACPPVAIIGGGPAGLIAAERLAGEGRRVVLFERMPAPGRKFLLAGRGGLNLTHTEPARDFLARYRAGAPALEPAIRAFSPVRLRQWAHDLGQDTFVGTSGRVFPRAMKASPLLRAWLARLNALGVDIRTRHLWRGWDADGRLVFDSPHGAQTIKAEATILALGGASWPRLGSDGAWTDILAARGVAITPLRPANCGFEIAWSAALLDRHAGAPLKPLAVSFRSATCRGEAVITRTGLEGGVIYALSGPVRDAVMAGGPAEITLDLKPDMPLHEVEGRLVRSARKDTLTNRLRKALGLSPAAVSLLREAGRLPEPAPLLARRVKSCRLTVTAARPIDRAISSAGGVALPALTADFMIRDLPGVFVAGEMIDWEAPTGGYLLQACFATGVAAAAGAAAFLRRDHPASSPDDRSHSPVARSPDGP